MSDLNKIHIKLLVPDLITGGRKQALVPAVTDMQRELGNNSLAAPFPPLRGRSHNKPLTSKMRRGVFSLLPSTTTL